LELRLKVNCFADAAFASHASNEISVVGVPLGMLFQSFTMVHVCWEVAKHCKTNALAKTNFFIKQFSNAKQRAEAAHPANKSEWQQPFCLFL
jgi:hypothetical protein